MKLKVAYELSISAENEGLVPVIASQEGWNAESGITAQEYINKYVAIPEVNLLMERIVFRAIDAYFGLKDKALAEGVKAQYQQAVTITSEFIA